MKVGDKAYTDKKEAGAALVEMCKEMKTVNVPATVGNMPGLKWRCLLFVQPQICDELKRAVKP